MILIKGEDFEMEQVKTSSSFDLSVLTPINEGKDNERQEMKLWGYGMTFEACLKTIIIHRMSELKETFSVAEYIDRYKLMVDEFIKTIKTEIITKASKKDDDN